MDEAYVDTNITHNNIKNKGKYLYVGTGSNSSLKEIYCNPAGNNYFFKKFYNRLSPEMRIKFYDIKIKFEEKENKYRDEKG